MRRSACVAVYAVSLCLTACHADDKTGLFATVRWSGIAVDQLEITVNAAPGAPPLVAPTLRPAQQAASLSSPQTVAIYLPDAVSGSMVTCMVTGLAGGTRLDASAAQTVTISRSNLLPVELDIGSASTGKANGQPCGDGSECDSTLCVDGVCCASTCGGLCLACNVKGKEGLCMPVPAGTQSTICAQQLAASCGFDGTCDGSGGCHRYPAGAACAASLCQTATLLLSASACDGQGACVTPPAISCAPDRCDAATLRCGTSCVTDNDCAGSSCVNGSCGMKPKGDLGVGCVVGSDCASTFCQDGVCCESACTASCTSCNQTGLLGMCKPVPAGKIDLRGACQDQGVTSCATNGLCDGAGACALYPSGATCAAGQCSGGHFVRSTKQCDGKGACVAAQDIDCNPYRCDPTTTACFTSCTANTECALGLGKTCQASGVCM